MARKQEFDPLGGFVGGGSARKGRKDKKSYDVLGSGKYGDSGAIFDEGNYEPEEVTGYSDALLATGGSEDERKPQKHGLFSGLFKKKDKKPVQPAAPAEEPVQDPGFDSSRYGIEIKDGVMETGIIKRYQEPEDEAPLFDDEPVKAPQKEEVVPDNAPLFEDVPENEADLFSEPETKPAENPAVEPQEDLFADEPEPEAKPAAPVTLNPHVCHLCGRTSAEEWPEFGFSEEEFVPLCKTCTRAVATLLKHTDPSDEAEIISEWGQICPGLNEKRAKELVAKGRNLHR
ncbi:MAG TPA: hypothetical protein O0X39_07145 [Methanocorpusculum sp.]|nr:hypothetical protein [Methanocorpusculum sp.]